MLALPGPAFDRSLTLEDFCGEFDTLEEPLEEAPMEDAVTHGDS